MSAHSTLHITRHITLHYIHIHEYQFCDLESYLSLAINFNLILILSDIGADPKNMGLGSQKKSGLWTQDIVVRVLLE